jgi:hypothetical protein
METMKNEEIDSKGVEKIGINKQEEKKGFENKIYI